MRLFAAIVPPRDVLDELDDVVRSVSPGAKGGRAGRSTAGRPSAGEGHHARPRRGLLGRRRDIAGQGAGAGGAPDRDAVRQVSGPLTDQLDRLPVARLHIPITTFGHLTGGDSERLAAALRDAAAGWDRPTLRLAGGTALEFPGDKAVWARLDGTLDPLWDIAKGVPQVVQRLGLFVDRRQFRPWLSVGTINDATTASYLEDLVAALERFEGMTWTQETLSLMSGQPEAGPSEPFEETETMPLAAR